MGVPWLCRWRKRQTVRYDVENLPRNPATLNEYVTLMSRGDGRSSISDSTPSEPPSPTTTPVLVTAVIGSAGGGSSGGSTDSGASITEQSHLLLPSPSHPPSAVNQLYTDDYICNDVFFGDIGDIQKDSMRDNPEGCSITSSSSDLDD